jgi:hypothetical protein
MADQTSTKPMGSTKYWQMYVHGIPYIIRFTIGWKHTTWGPLWALNDMYVMYFLQNTLHLILGFTFGLSLIFDFHKVNNI